MALGRCIALAGLSPRHFAAGDLDRSPKQDGLLVVGSHGLDALDRFMRGSVSLKVLHHATCSVLVVR
jgi:nucleotide-binding universal stress UspA family protein